MRQFLRGTKGAIAIVTAILLPVLIGFAAWAIDASLLLYRQERLQVAVDIGARAGAEVLRRNGTEAAAHAFAQRMTEINSGAQVGTLPDVTVITPQPDRVEVTATLGVERIFSAIFGRGDFTVMATSVAVFVPDAPHVPCVYIDHPRAQRAMRLDRDSILSLTGCDVLVVSDHGRALVLERDAVLRADCVDVAGGISGTSQIESSLCEAPGTGVVVPPLTLVVEVPPRPSGSCNNRNSGEPGPNGTPDVLSPVGRHPSGLAELRLCDGLKIMRDTVGGPGIYFVSGDDLEIESGATLTLGPGAILVLQDETEIDMDKTGRLRITAPQEGMFDGLAIITGHDRGAPSGFDHTLGVIEIDGAVLLPGEEINIIGRSTVAKCTRVGAGRLELARDAQFESRCIGSGAHTEGSVRLLPSP